MNYPKIKYFCSFIKSKLIQNSRMYEFVLGKIHYARQIKAEIIKLFFKHLRAEIFIFLYKLNVQFINVHMTQLAEYNKRLLNSFFCQSVYLCVRFMHNWELCWAFYCFVRVKDRSLFFVDWFGSINKLFFYFVNFQ